MTAEPVSVGSIRTGNHSGGGNWALKWAFVGIGSGLDRITFPVTGDWIWLVDVMLLRQWSVSEEAELLDRVEKGHKATTADLNCANALVLGPRGIIADGGSASSESEEDGSHTKVDMWAGWRHIILSAKKGTK
uniref:Protein kinase domain-containing protein n=1 Tax=Panagrellus redivivus TaxID=6233 RepID=A0A7E4ZZB6_PANRE